MAPPDRCFGFILLSNFGTVYLNKFTVISKSFFIPSGGSVVPEIKINENIKDYLAKEFLVA
jgi:hypothetical protein